MQLSNSKEWWQQRQKFKGGVQISCCRKTTVLLKNECVNGMIGMETVGGTVLEHACAITNGSMNELETALTLKFKCPWNSASSHTIEISSPGGSPLGSGPSRDGAVCGLGAPFPESVLQVPLSVSCGVNDLPRQFSQCKRRSICWHILQFV